LERHRTHPPTRRSEEPGRHCGFAKSAGFEIVAEFYDPAVSGVDPIETRPGFADAVA
jgi:hypothetical protein